MSPFRFLPVLAILTSASLLAGLCKAQTPQASPAAPYNPIPQVVGGTEITRGEGGAKVARSKEDYSSLTLEGSDLVPRDPVRGGHEENKDFVRDLYQVQWRDNDPIDLYVIRPAGVKKAPVILYLYSYPSDGKRFQNSDYCRRVTANGAAAVGFVSALTGERYHSRPFKEWFVSELPESLATTVHDVQMILDLLATRDDLDMTRVGMFGQGSGGSIAILAASVDPRIKALDLLAPWGDWPDWLNQSTVIPPGERGTYGTPDVLRVLDRLEPVRALPKLTDRNIRIQFVDSPPPMKSTKALEDAAPKNAVIIHYDGVKQMLDASGGGRLFEWLPQQLKTDGTHPGSTQAAVRKSSEGGAN